MWAELCGDGPLTLTQRVTYLARNSARNIRSNGRIRLRRRWFRADRPCRVASTASPSRALTLAFLDSQLPALLRVGRVRVLEIGCGSGSLAGTLANVGYHGTYLGVDVQDRFDRSTAVPEFEKTFIHADARGLEPDKAFDLVISISALEHIPDDSRLTNRLGTFLAPGGIQLHFVPSAWGLAVYLWHGYRQYTRSSLADRFDPDTTIAFALGGGASFLLHFLAITVGEMLLRIPVRRRWPGIYDRLLEHSLRLDPLLPICSTVYAVYQAPSRPESRCS